MEENFNPVARTRANYYTPGSPVQFVCVELLRGDVSGENAVCLTFKNISRVTLTALEVHFKCKGVDGVILCEDQFEYRDIEVKPGELFGMDDAVFVTQKAITSVDVVLKNVYSGKKGVKVIGLFAAEEVCKRRMRTRGDSKEAVSERVEHDRIAFAPARRIASNPKTYALYGLQECCDVVFRNNFASVKGLEDEIPDLVYQYIKRQERV